MARGRTIAERDGRQFMRQPNPLIAALTAASLLSPAVAGAQARHAPPSAVRAAPITKVSDQSITRAAAVMWRVMTLRQAYIKRLSRAKPEDRGLIAREYESAINKAVTDQGLTVPQYDAIIRLARNDPTVRQRLFSHLPRRPNRKTPHQPAL